MTLLKAPTDFFWRRIHSITGLWISVFLIMHLLTNSQAAIFFGDDGEGFIHGVNSIHELPFLPLIEIFVLAVPILLHALWGIQYLRTSKENAYLGREGATPSLHYSRNRAYTWQRITAWILLIGVAAHVIHMRFINYPTTVEKSSGKEYLVDLSEDPGLPTVAARLGVSLYSPQEIENIRSDTSSLGKENDPVLQQRVQQEIAFSNALEEQKIDKGQVVAVAKDFGTAELLMVRDVFKQPIMLVLYTFLVLSACFHGFNGLWTAMITWGVTLTPRSQNLMRKLTIALIVGVSFLGLMAIWGTYWINLRS